MYVLLIHHGPPGHMVGVDEAVEVNDGHLFLLGSGCIDLGLEGTRLWQPLPGLLLGLLCVKKHSRLVHGDNIFQHHHGSAADHCQEHLAHSHSLLLRLYSHLMILLKICGHIGDNARLLFFCLAFRFFWSAAGLPYFAIFVI
jgi:hypothetical protein